MSYVAKRLRKRLGRVGITVHSGTVLGETFPRWRPISFPQCTVIPIRPSFFSTPVRLIILTFTVWHNINLLSYNSVKEFITSFGTRAFLRVFRFSSRRKNQHLKSCVLRTFNVEVVSVECFVYIKGTDTRCDVTCNVACDIARTRPHHVTTRATMHMLRFVAGNVARVELVSTSATLPAMSHARCTRVVTRCL